MNAAAGAGEQKFPWDEAMTIGLGLLRLSPRDFWSMTPREFACMARVVLPAGRVAPGRAELEALMHRFPDGRTSCPKT